MSVAYVAVSVVLDGTISVVYLPSRMKVGVTTKRVGKAHHAIARIILFCLPIFLFLQIIGQAEHDGRYPLTGARSVGAKIVKQDYSHKSGLTHVLQPSLAVGSRLFTPGFYLTFVRNTSQQDFVRTPLVSLRSSRSPPRTAVA